VSEFLWTERAKEQPRAIDREQALGILQAAGKRIALANLLIGSTALELGYSVATANARHFPTIPDLVIEQL